ncbi:MULTISPECIES: hypothetical protein [unclassified Methylibium]|uniref:hypothetical protein n=1 Tax=unclassified Methylibium TaxID=2633235 RepID=UPI0003F45EBF|nr:MULTISPECIES: hypothetical protein [unclassified Methylibium]EWS53407.1 hypothetical protein X551_03808 [Methylibium sp. T29]EWS58579.1 hypothetical protein Y694_03546 [Methylibium sp. T29-B]
MTDPTSFMAGVALMDEMLREAERQAAAEVAGEDVSGGFWIEADIRGGVDLNIYLRPLVAELISRPELIEGFSAALGDYLGTLCAGLVPANGDAYTNLSYDDIMVFVPPPEEEPVSNVIPIRPASSAAAEIRHS